MSAVSPADATLAWEVELDRLELDILRVERLVTAFEPLAASDWVTPSLTAPLPPHLLERVQDIHERQGKALQQILRALHTAQKQRRYVDRVTGDEQHVPRYVDLTA